MSAIRLQKVRPDDGWRLEEQFEICGLPDENRKDVKQYLIKNGIYELEQLEELDFRNYKKFLIQCGQHTKKESSIRTSVLRKVYDTWIIAEYSELLEQLENCCGAEKQLLGNIKRFLIQNKIYGAESIDYELREQYEKFLRRRISMAHIDRYLKAFDRLKQFTIKEELKSIAGRQKSRMVYQKQVIFLPYLKNQELAKDYEYVQDKSELVWDFRLKAPEQMKRQIFDILNYALDHVEDMKDRRVRYLLPLKWLYEYCVEKDVADIEGMLLPQVEEFEQKVATKVIMVKQSMQIVDNSRKILFTCAKDIHWHATVWYMERMNLAPERTNPSNPVRKISFYEVINKNNRELLQEYVKYQLGITGLTVGNIRSQLYDLKKLMKYFEEDSSICNVDAIRLDEYFWMLQEENTRAETFNKKLVNINKFYEYLVVKKYIKKIPFESDYYIQKTYPVHLDRSVEESIYMEILEKLKYFPEEPRLIFLNLWCAGLRVSEACTLKGDAFYWDGDDAWVKVYQIKLKADKMIPIPLVLYRIMRFYIDKKRIRAREYIFKGQDGGAYRVGSFMKMFKKYCTKSNIDNGDYLFKSHDYRHTLATRFYEDGVSIQTIRDYLGHFNEEMTKQYIDYMPRRIAKANEELFEKSGNPIANAITVKKRGDGHEK